ncbi:MAG: hypothetical protein WC605_02835 [Bacteroidales bacterium]
MKNFLVLSVVTVLIFHNVFALYAEVFFSSDTQWESTFKENEQPDVLSFTEAQSDLIDQFIFDSEFKNINANITVFEEHRNLNSEIKFNSGHVMSLTLPECIAGVSFSSILSTYCFSIPNSCKQALLCNLYSFRI